MLQSAKALPNEKTKETKNVSPQIALREDEEYSSALPLLLPVSRSLLTPVVPFFRFTSFGFPFPAFSGLEPFRNGLTGFLITVEIRSGLLHFRSPRQLAGDGFRFVLSPHTGRRLSESIEKQEVVSCSSHWFFTILLYYTAIFPDVNKISDRALFFYQYNFLFFSLNSTGSAQVQAAPRKRPRCLCTHPISARSAPAQKAGETHPLPHRVLQFHTG